MFLREAGYRPRALFLDMLDAADLRQGAVAAAESLGVELIVERCAERFRDEVRDYVLTEHVAGRTPAPCSRCNPGIKWRLLADAADRLGIRHIATGHYVRTVRHTNGRWYFRRGADLAKDQSYYLWDVPENYIERAVLPLGDYTKAEVRSLMAERYGLTELAERRESMGVCFLGSSTYGDFLRSGLPEGVVRTGEVVDLAGRVIGRHDGYPLYTAGQKRGLSLFHPDETAGWAVVGVDAANNRITVGPDEAMWYDTLLLKEWRTPELTELLTHGPQVQAAVRGIGRNPLPGCGMEIDADGRLRITLLQDKAWALSPGQPVVLYLGDRVVGGGILAAAHH